MKDEYEYNKNKAHSSQARLEISFQFSMPPFFSQLHASRGKLIKKTDNIEIKES